MWLMDVSLPRVTGTSEHVVLVSVASDGLYPSCNRIQDTSSSEAGFG